MKCRAQRCTEGNRQYLFPGHIDTNSLVVQDEYVFTQVCIAKDYFFVISIVSLIFSFKGGCFCELWMLFTHFFVSMFAPLCNQFTVFHQTSHNSFFQHTCSPPVWYVFWLCFVSFVSGHAKVFQFLHRHNPIYSWKKYLCALQADGKGTMKRQVAVLIIILHDFDSN